MGGSGLHSGTGASGPGDPGHNFNQLAVFTGFWFAGELGFRSRFLSLSGKQFAFHVLEASGCRSDAPNESELWILWWRCLSHKYKCLIRPAIAEAFP